MAGSFKKKVISELCEVTSSKRIFASEYQNEGVPFYRGKEIGEKHHGKLNVSTELFISRDKFNKIRSKFGIPKHGDLLLTSIGALLGSPYVVKQGEEFYFKDGNVTWFRNFEGLDSHFLYYWLLSPQGKGELEKSKIGSAQPAFTIRLLKRMEIDLPPLEIQHRIASILSAYDDLIENNTRRIAILEEVARRLYQEWFVHFRFPGHEKVRLVDSELGKIPEGWEVVTIAGVTDFLSRGIAPIYAEEATCRVINQRCIRDHKLSMEPARRQQKKVPAEKYVRLGDILINSTGVGTLGRVAQVCEVLEETTVDSHVTIVRPTDHLDHDFFGVALLELQPHFESQGVGSTGQTELNRVRVGETQIVLPPPGLQHTFGASVSPMRQLALLLEKKSANLRTQRDLLLPKLISGEIDVSTLPAPEKSAAA